MSMSATTVSQPKTIAMNRISPMLRLDFYRLFHTPLLYIMMAVAAVIPALVMTMSGASTTDASGKVVEPTIVYTNAFQLIAPQHPQYVISDFGDYANINMVYIFGGILLAIFIGHDYMSGFVKNVFTVHSKKRDYVISKIAIGTFSMICMIGTYVLGSMVSGLLNGKSFSVSIVGLLLCLVAKVILALGFSSLFVMISVLFRRLLGISIVGSFFFGTGMLVMGAAAVLASMGLESLMGVFLYGAASGASLSSTWITVIVSLACSAAWALIYTQLSTFILNHRDLA